MPAEAYTSVVSAGAQRRERSAPGLTGPLVGALACLIALVVVYLLASHVHAVGVRDASLLHRLTLLDGPTVESVGNFLLHLLEPLVFVLWGGAVVAVALAGGRTRAACAAVAVMVLAPLTSETLKPLLAHPHVQDGAVHIGAASWPSGHSTAALSLAIAAVLAAPVRLRGAVVAIGSAFALACGVFLLILAWHMPSDVLGGYLVAALWGSLALAWMRRSERATSPRRRAG